MSQRLDYLDNLRWFLVLNVVGYHATLAYMSLGSYQWPIPDDKNHVIFDGLARLGDIFSMPALFFIAGYFLVSSLSRSASIWSFIKKKILRLCIPFILGIIFLTPINSYVEEISKAGYDQGYLSFLVNLYYPGRMTADHLWYLMFLFLLTVLFSIAVNLTMIKRGNVSDKNHFQGDSAVNTAPSLRFLMLFFITTVMVYFISSGLYIDNQWLKIGQEGIIRIQLSRTPLYFLYFGFGIYASVKKWDFSAPITKSGDLGLAILTATVVIGMWIFSLFFYKTSLLIENSYVRFFNAVFHCATILCMLWMLLSIFSKKYNYTNSFTKLMNENSYSIYLVHMPIVIVSQYAMSQLEISALLKYSVVVLLALTFSLAISHLFLRRIPGLKRVL